MKWIDSLRASDSTTYPYPQDSVDRTLQELILATELPTSWTGAGTRDASERKMPTTKDIVIHWWEKLVQMNKFDSFTEVAEENFTICWSCGVASGSLERAHILARSLGGSDDVSNFHLLCAVCHRTSEELYGPQYWEWFTNNSFKSHIFTCRYTLDRAVKYNSEKLNADLGKSGLTLEGLQEYLDTKYREYLSR